jgi:DNA ligase-1
MFLAELVKTSHQIGATTKRLEKTDLLAGFLRRLRPDELAITISYLSGRIPQGKIGAGWSAIQDAAARPAPQPSLEIVDTDRWIQEISRTQGPGSAARRTGSLHRLFAAATEPEQRFLSALLIGELRQGSLEGLMAEAIAKASGIPLERVRRAAMMAGDIAEVGRAALEHGQDVLSRYDVQLFRPVQPMLAQTAEDVEEALSELGEAAIEYKMDGARVQVHKSGDDVAVFSRRLNDVTSAVPEVVEIVRAMPAHDLILDGEVIALMPDARPRRFQETMRRFGRKLDVDRMRDEMPLTPFFFDILYLNGGSLMDQSQSRRFAELSSIAPPGALIPNLVTSGADQAENFVRRALDRGHEGVMAKARNAAYAAGARGQSWLKVKQARTLDLVVLAAEWGHGRRRRWLSNLHLGARDTDKGGYAMLGKTFKGLTDEMLAWQTGQFLKIEIGRDAYTVYIDRRSWLRSRSTRSRLARDTRAALRYVSRA